MTRFLITTMPVTGHVSPLLPVAKALVECGHEVHWYSSKRYLQRIERTGALFIPFRLAQDIVYENINQLFPERAQLKGMAQGKWDMKHLIIDVAFQQYDDLAEILADDQPDVMIGDFFSWGAQFLAASKGIPYAVVNVVNLGFPSRDTAPDGLGFAPSATMAGHLRNRLLNWFVPHVLLRDVQVYLSQQCASRGLPIPAGTIFEFPFRTDLFLQPTVPTFEYPRSDLPDHIHFIGALLPEGPTDFALPAWWGDLDGKRPVVLVTQGTIATDFDELLNPALAGLAGEDVIVVGTTANRPHESVTVNPLPKNAHLVSFIPFDQLMPCVDVMVTNGGYGGTHFALTHGVPLVAGGTSEDKVEICARIAWSGVGVNLKTKAPSPAQIRDAVKAILHNHRYKENAEAMRTEFARHNAPEEAVHLLEQLARSGERRM